MPNPQIRRNLTSRQAVLRENNPPDRFLILRTLRNANRIPLELVAVYRGHIVGRMVRPLMAGMPSKDRNKTGTGPADDIVLPDRLDAEGVAPVWMNGLENNGLIAAWLTTRIEEIDRMVQKATTIAVLANDEEQVVPLAIELNSRLEETSPFAGACTDGKVVGNDRDVRVFNIRHIKGLEFEAVFFIGLDLAIRAHPDLFTKYLYVGATRAATYLGVTFASDIPAIVKPLDEHFNDHWRM